MEPADTAAPPLRSPSIVDLRSLASSHRSLEKKFELLLNALGCELDNETDTDNLLPTSASPPRASHNTPAGRSVLTSRVTVASCQHPPSATHSSSCVAADPLSDAGPAVAMAPGSGGAAASHYGRKRITYSQLLRLRLALAPTRPLDAVY